MQYGDLKQSMDTLYLYMGTNPANDNLTFLSDNALWPYSKPVNQRDADLLHFWHKVYVYNDSMLVGCEKRLGISFFVNLIVKFLLIVLLLVSLAVQ